MKKLLSVFLAVFMAAIFVGCGERPHGPDTDVTPPAGGGEEYGPEEGEGERGPEERPETAAELADADLLAFSFDRLEHADLSFDFTGGKKAAAFPAVLSDGKEEESHAPVEGETHSGTPGDLLPLTEDFFESNGSVLDLARERAENIRETVLGSVTLMNTAVHAGLYSYVLDYDAVTDTLHVIRAQKPEPNPSAVTETYDILIYPDEDGEETVEYWCVSTQTGRYDRATHLIYTPEKRYYIEQTDVFPSTGTASGVAYQSDVREMYRKGDDWFGYALMFRTDTPFFSRRGSYETADFFSLEFVTKRADGVVISATGDLGAYDAAGERKTSSESYASTDEFRFEVGGLSFGEIRSSSGSVSAPGSAVEGWDEVRLEYVSDGGAGLREEYTVDFANGVSLGPNDFYKRGYGILHYLNETREGGEIAYVCENAAGEKVSFASWEEMCADRVTLATRAVYVAGSPIHTVYFNFVPQFCSGDPLKLVGEFWEALGITAREGTGAPSDLFTAFGKADAQAVAEEIMLDLYDGALGLDGVERICLQAAENCDKTVARLKSLLDGYETVEWEEMPARPADLGLLALAGKVGGQAEISEAGIDYSSLTLEVEKSVLFSKGKEYALYIAWGAEVEAVSDPLSYRGENFTFTGKLVPLPDLPVGTFEAGLFLGKVMEEGCARLSDIVPVSASGTFTLMGGTERGMQKTTDFLSEEGLKAVVDRKDFEAPEISVDGVPAAETPYELAFRAEEGKTVSDLFEHLTVTDNSVGKLTARSGSFALEGEEVFAGDLLVTGVYVYTVKDGSGNSARVTFRVTVEEAEEGTE